VTLALDGLDALDALLHPPEVPVEQRGSATVSLRYEDVAEDGRLLLQSMSPALGECVWKRLLLSAPSSLALRAQGIVPVLSRIVLEGGVGPHGINDPLTVDGRYELAHAALADGSVDRLFVNMWAEARAPIGRTHGPPPDSAGTVVRAGRVFGEHVLTRLFAAPEDRKVRRIDAEGLPALPPARYDWRLPKATMDLPLGAVALDELSPEPTPIAFGLMHTDSNQHVNSLVYPRLFEEAALRRFGALGRGTRLLARVAECSYRKPSFAGERVRIVLSTFTLGDRVGAVGAFVDDTDAFDTTRARAYVRMIFEG
jgi:acyl-CoA thioesterase FadM